LAGTLMAVGAQASTETVKVPPLGKAAITVQHLVRPATVMPSHVNEQATVGGVERAGTRVDRFIRQARAFTEVVLPLGDVTRHFDGGGRCIGCR